MDAPEEDLDIKLQKISGDLIADFDNSINILLRKQDGSLRSRVRSREAYRLSSNVLGSFQDLPQLLDPHLPKWLSILAEAYLEHLQTRRHRTKPLSLRDNLLMPLNRALSRLLYTLCKVRGEKIIVRFLNVEARYLEPILAAVEDDERAIQAGGLAQPTQTQSATTILTWNWEERYVALLWLSHLMLVPFDLSTISSVTVEDEDIPTLPGFRWPRGLPGIAVRILPIAVKYISTPGKERDAAKSLLVRLSMRKDMQQLGVLDALVQWALSALRPKDGDSDQTAYQSIGVLSYLAGVLTSSLDTSDMDKYLASIFRAVHSIASEEGSESNHVSSSAVARKMAIKVIRSIAVLVLRDTQQDMDSMEIVETTIGYLLEGLADNDTPVRFAASKALSIITLRLDADMASQVVDAVLEALNKNVIWIKNPQDPSAPRTRDLSTVDALEWHGLMLTLSHLLYRRSPPAENLADIAYALIMGLSFEQRSASGVSVGTNVRDAACFGVWALSRRYTTKELLAVSMSRGLVSKSYSTNSSLLQILATELVVAACLDPAGNIRRGSSAALQELIGRHPDTVEQGIWVVQAVDYHAVARRSRAIQEVALAATRLSAQYGETVLDALLGWRGIGYSDAAARRSAGIAYGTVTAELALSAEDPVQRLADSIELVLKRIKSLQQREVEELHGLLLSFAAVLDSLPTMTGSAVRDVRPSTSLAMAGLIQSSTSGLCAILRDCESRTYRRPELVAEGACRLIISAFPLLQASSLDSSASGEIALPETTLVPGPTLTSSIRGTQFSDIVSALDSARAAGHHPPLEAIALIKTAVCEWLNRQEQDVVVAASGAALVLLVFCPNKEREDIIRRWADAIRHRQSSRVGTVGGYFAALAKSFPIVTILDVDAKDKVSLLTDAIRTRWAGDKDIETRVSILQSLAQSEVLRQNATIFLDLVSEGLDDYTTNARGDVGSHVRLEAIRVVKSLWADLDREVPEDATLQAVVSQVFLRILRLAAEKLDRVRAEAQSALLLAINSSYSGMFGTSTFSSQAYFGFLFNLFASDWLHPAISATARASHEAWMDELMAGIVGSADTGNEDLVIATRAAICDFCEASPDNLSAVCTALMRNLKGRQGNDRVMVPTLEIVAFLIHVGIFGKCADSGIDYRGLCLQVQKAGYKTGNVRKIEACIRVYGALATINAQEEGAEEDAVVRQRRDEGIAEARKRLGALMFHPWPRVRTLVVDEVWGILSGRAVPAGSGPGLIEPDRAEALKGMDWGKAEKGVVKALVEKLGLS